MPLIRQLLMILSALLLTPGAASAQPFAVAGTGCSLGRADDSGLHRVYWELLNLTEICLETPVTPADVKLSFVLVFQGKAVTGAPVSDRGTRFEPSRCGKGGSTRRCIRYPIRELRAERLAPAVR